MTSGADQVTASRVTPADTDRWSTVRAYISLCKPRIIELLLITTFPVMFLAERGVPSWWLVIATLVGGTLSASSANVLNCYLDRDIDAPETMAALLADMGLPAHRVIDEALSDANKLRLRRQTETAMEKGIFGAPTFFVGEEMFWGNDRLDDALAFARAQAGA